MDPILTINAEDLRVQPDSEARVTATVGNIGDLVEQYRLEVLGEAARWSDVSPRQISVLPRNQEQKAVEVIFRPTSALAVAGTVAWAVRCVSLEDPDRCAVVEGTVTVAAVVGLQARLEPVSPAGRWTGRYLAVFDNTGTMPVALRLSAEDTRRALRFALAPTDLSVQPGRSATAYLSVQSRQPRLRGRAATHPFTVSYAQPGQPATGVLPGNFEQRPVLSRLVVIAALAAVVVVGAAGALLALRQQPPTEPAALEGPPPPVTLTAVAPLTGTSVQLVWQRSPYATGYVVQQVLADSTVTGSMTVDDRDQSALTWPDLPAGRQCFQVRTLGAAKARSAPSPPRCATLTGPAPTASPAVSGGPGLNGQPSPSGPGTDPSGQPPGGGPGDQSSPTGPGDDPVLGAYAIYGTPWPVDDAATAGEPERLLATVQQAGVQARLVDSRSSRRIPDGPNDRGVVVVIQDQFPNLEAARAECKAHLDIAPGCYALDPK